MRAHHYRRRLAGETEIDVTTFLNLMVVLVPFLLITAVFSRITIVELDLPSAADGSSAREPEFRVEVIVRNEGLSITNGQVEIARIPKEDGEYDLDVLGDHMLVLKQEHPRSNQASVLLEPQIPYDYLIRVMDVVRGQSATAARPSDAAQVGERGPQVQVDEQTPAEPLRLALFTDISVGEAP